MELNTRSHGFPYNGNEEEDYLHNQGINYSCLFLIYGELQNQFFEFTSRTPSSWSVQTSQHESGRDRLLHLQACHACP